MKTVYDIWTFFSPFLKAYKKKLFFLLLLPLLWCLAETIAPYLIKIIIDSLAEGSFDTRSGQILILYTILLYAFLMLVLECSLRFCNYVWIKTFPYIRADIQKNIFELTQNQPFHIIYNQFAGDLINKYRNLTDGFEKISKIFLYGFYPTILSFVFALIFIAYINVFFSVIFLFWFVAMNFVTLFFFKKHIAAANSDSRIQNRLMGHIGDFICNAITMITFPRALSEQVEFQCLVQENIVSTQKLEFVNFKADLWRSIASWMLLVSMIVFLGYGWQKSWITLGDFSFIGTVCFYVRRSIWMTAMQFSEFFKELGIIQEALLLVFDIQHQPQNKSAPINPQMPIMKEVSIGFHQVHFSYSTDKILFKNFNLQIPVGQKLGIAGSSGAGKTTLMQLILRLYDPSQGVITINDHDSRDFDVKELRNYFSYVPQGMSLLHRSIYDNIAFGQPGSTPEEVYEAAKICLCDEFVPFLDKGYDTIIGEDAYNLSGGQCQRIALARAYLKKAPVFLLDEVTSGLDPELEKRLLDNLCDNLQSSTLILISHRPLALSKMDRVIELKQGAILF